MTTPKNLCANGFRLTVTTTISTLSADLALAVALSLMASMTPFALARPARAAQPAPR
ncbi:MAG TPA: hypothetical protein VES95_00545 [Dermatophilaceae bacterium]|nr:hypothetical protein [Dermatophilaceae bacterium]